MPVQTISPEMMIRLTQFCILASKLPGRSRALPLRCDRCGNMLGGLVANDAAVVHGHFEPDIKVFDTGCEIGTKLVGYTIIQGKAEFKCASCGEVKRWHR
jgi:hypothetical protein